MGEYNYFYSIFGSWIYSLTIYLSILFKIFIPIICHLKFYVLSFQPRMDQYFIKMEKMIKEQKTSPRIRVMLQDLLDLRRVNWKRL